VRLRDRPSGRTLRVYNTHLYLTESARLPAVRAILARIGSGDASDAVLVAGDFNAIPGAPSRRLFQEAGLIPETELAKKPAGQPTHQFYGIRLRSLDGLYLSPHWRLLEYRVVDVKPANTFPSDHFGVLADLRLEGKVAPLGTMRSRPSASATPPGTGSGPRSGEVNSRPPTWRIVSATASRTLGSSSPATASRSGRNRRAQVR
jgi:hypothetical protein